MGAGPGGEPELSGEKLRTPPDHRTNITNTPPPIWEEKFIYPPYFRATRKLLGPHSFFLPAILKIITLLNHVWEISVRPEE